MGDWGEIPRNPRESPGEIGGNRVKGGETGGGCEWKKALRVFEVRKQVLEQSKKAAVSGVPF